jgi:hypothetical protein
MQLDTGMSINRYFPPSGTAGFDRSRVKGNSREPAPPPRTTATTLSYPATPTIVKLKLVNRESQKKRIVVEGLQMATFTIHYSPFNIHL